MKELNCSAGTFKTQFPKRNNHPGLDLLAEFDGAGAEKLLGVVAGCIS
jgi:hypothetical protein